MFSRKSRDLFRKFKADFFSLQILMDSDPKFERTLFYSEGCDLELTLKALEVSADTIDIR